MKISLEEARAYWAHPSQHDYGIDESGLSDKLVYFAKGDVCLGFEEVLLPGFAAVHIGVKRKAWGNTLEPVGFLLAEFSREYRPRYLIAWIEDHKRHAIALSLRAGFSVLGKMPGTTMVGRNP